MGGSDDGLGKTGIGLEAADHLEAGEGGNPHLDVTGPAADVFLGDINPLHSDVGADVGGEVGLGIVQGIRTLAPMM